VVALWERGIAPSPEATTGRGFTPPFTKSSLFRWHFERLLAKTLPPSGMDADGDLALVHYAV
jgi:hypothetical protein